MEKRQPRSLRVALARLTEKVNIFETEYSLVVQKVRAYLEKRKFLGLKDSGTLSPEVSHPVREHRDRFAQTRRKGSHHRARQISKLIPNLETAREN